MTQTVALPRGNFKHLFDSDAACRVTDKVIGTYVRSYNRSNGLTPTGGDETRRVPMATTFAAPAYATSALPGFRPRTRPKDSSAISARDARSRGRQQVAPRGATAPGLRMTRRGRLVVLAVALMVVLLPGAWRAMATAQVEGPVTVAVTVQPGDTLWGIAAAIDPGADPRALIAEIRELNAMTQSGLVPGQVLVVPAG